MFLAVSTGNGVDAALAKARQDARTALALDDEDPWSNFALGFIECIPSQYEAALTWFRRAIDINPNFALAHGYSALALAWGGQPDAALEAVGRAVRMSPRDPFNPFYLHMAAAAHFAAERYTEAVTCEEQLLRERPNVSFALRYLAACYVYLGQLEKARATISQLLLIQPNSSIKRDALGYVLYARSVDNERYVAALRKAGLPEE